MGSLLDRLLEGGESGAEDGTRTRDPHLGKVMLYQLSHFRSNVHRPVGGAESQIRTGDTAIFSRVLYQLSYLGPSHEDGGPPRRRARRYHGPRGTIKDAGQAIDSTGSRAVAQPGRVEMSTTGGVSAASSASKNGRLVKPSGPAISADGMVAIVVL